jgi:hypothetical protein
LCKKIAKSFVKWTGAEAVALVQADQLRGF